MRAYPPTIAHVVAALGVLYASAALAEPMPGMEHDDSHDMAMRGALGLPMSRMGSGTSWLPDDTPVRAVHFMRGDWAFMVHGNVMAGLDVQGGHAGDPTLVSQNWIMGM